MILSLFTFLIHLWPLFASIQSQPEGRRRSMHGTLSTEIEVGTPASQAWQLYGTGLRLSEVVEQQLSSLVQKIEAVEGDGGVGTVLNIIFASDVPGFSSYKEKYTKVDNEKKIKEAEVVEGGYLDLGFTLYRVRFEVIEKREDSCITRATIEYELMEESAANASIVSIQPLRMILEAAAKQLLNRKD